MKTYHYTECGLDNIYLVNGFKITRTKRGDEEIFINDIHGLHKMIGKILILKPRLLMGKEIKFIRVTLDFSQTTLAKMLGVNYQSVLAWEKSKTPISKTADHLLRIIFLSYLDDKIAYSMINEIADLDAKEIKNKAADKIELEEVANEWRAVDYMAA